MKARFLLFIPLLLLSACANLNNHHPFNAVPLEKWETCVSNGISSVHNIFPLGTYSPDSVNVDIQSEIQQVEDNAIGMPDCWRVGLGKGFSVGLQGSYAIRGGMDHCAYESSSSAEQVHGKAYLTKSFNLAQGLYLAVSPAASISKGVGSPARSYRIKYTHKGVEIPLTLSYQRQYPFQNENKCVELVFSGTLRRARDYFKGDMNRCGAEAFTTIWYYNQPQNMVNRYAAMAHIDVKLFSMLVFSVQYGWEYGKGVDYSDECPIFYAGFGIDMNGKTKP